MTRTTKKAVNEVFLGDGGIIHTVYHGEQNGRGLQQTMQRIGKIMEILLKQDLPVRLLVDIRDMGSYDTWARLVEMQARTVLPFWKMAFVTSNMPQEGEQVSRKLTQMSGRRKEIRYFQREDDAVGWLSFMSKSM